jgi:hypothetical protein
MELKELITKIKNFRKTIISVDEYMNPNSDNYLFESEYFEYKGSQGSYIFKKSDEEKRNFATSTMIKNIEYELNIIDIELLNLKIEDEEKYFKFKDIICRLDNDIEEFYKIKEILFRHLINKSQD